MRIDSKVVAITGGAGFIGSHLVDSLLARGCRVIVFDSLARGNMSNLPSKNERLTLKNIDLVSTARLEREIEDVEVLFDLAAKSPGNRDLYKNPADLVSTNVGITLNVARAVSNVGVDRVVFVSSSCVYDHEKAVVPHIESDVGLSKLSYYGWSKLMGEAVYSAYAEQYGLRACVARIFNAYGPRESLKSPHVIPEFIMKAFECKKGSRTFEILGDGAQTRSFLFVSDAVEGLIRLAESGLSETVNFGSPREVSIRELATLVLHEVGVKPSDISFISSPVSPRDIRRRSPDISKANSLLSWKPNVELEEGLQITTKWWSRVRTPL
jgi:GDP-D-mannose 3',5'-epimerase